MGKNKKFTLRVVKFGGTCVDTPQKMLTSAYACKNRIEEGEKLLVVLSAKRGRTDELIKFTEMVASGDMDRFMDVLVLGEIESCRIFRHVLEDMGVKARVIEPSSTLWPVWLKNGELWKEKTEEKRKKLGKMLEAYDVLIFPGFVAREKGKRLVSLGRGGSDVSAFLLARIFGADEVIIVKDVPGVYQADPKLFKTSKIKVITADELSTLSSLGAKVLHPDALSYKKKSIRARIIHHGEDLMKEGTFIDGEVKREISVSSSPLSLITIHYGDEFPAGIFECLSSYEIYGISMGSSYLGIYVKEEVSDKIARKFLDFFPQHRIVKKDGIGMVVLKKKTARDRPGLINKVTEILARHGINLVELSSIGREIILYVSFNDLGRVLNLLTKYG